MARDVLSVSEYVTFEAGVWEQAAMESGKYIYLMICEVKDKEKETEEKIDRE